ncbi:diacylglycerol kinase [Mangrovimonas yunxiaonensis]|uniref:Diacylglycerol kinase n=1 Tax=Mangrovimonas yunxiaonensis TaxID=1197477 RepID=A0A084TJV2_9FLAO|nr:diacylglycerol kinase family protein [Mangrovimonas yunxiaonensis]KFB00988.1 diacylglycerol kinase [Mangrovimonas yunxiaonensis]GGH43172.1 diacylglycerol kinase [Mangrovimonas yunxiaonensis]
MSKKEPFLKNRLKSIGYAYKGAKLLLKTESSIKIQFAVAFIVTIAGVYFKLSPTEWMIQILAIGLIVAVEGLNTAIEKMADFIHPEHHNKIGFIKDIAAGAVFYAAITAIIIGLFIYLPKIFEI